MKKATVLHWQTHEYAKRDRSADWFWAVGIITIALAATSIILNNILFAIVIVLSGFVLSLYAARPPQVIDVLINEKGVRIDRTFYAYPTLESFWIEEHEENEGDHILLLKSQRLIMPYITISLGETEPEQLRTYLSQYLPEVFHSESNLHKLMERIGF